MSDPDPIKIDPETWAGFVESCRVDEARKKAGLPPISALPVYLVVRRLDIEDEVPVVVQHETNREPLAADLELPEGRVEARALAEVSDRESRDQIVDAPHERDRVDGAVDLPRRDGGGDPVEPGQIVLGHRLLHRPPPTGA